MGSRQKNAIMTGYKKMSPARVTIYVLVAVTIWSVLATIIGIYGAFVAAAGGGDVDIWINWAIVHFFMALGGGFMAAMVSDIWGPV
jgi:membrane protein DedA with SNARE-associated domain